MATDAVSIANIPYWPFLPMGTTNFGGDRQLFTIDTQPYAPIGCSLNGLGLYTVNGHFNTPIFNNWGVHNPVGYNFNYGFYC